jgi:hypothetical protein
MLDRIRTVLTALVLALPVVPAVGAYDSYYSPGGNNVTWPVGPS